MTVKHISAFAAAAAVLLVLSAGCSTQAKRVDCEKALKPINRPAPAVAMPTQDSQVTDQKPSHEK